MTQSPPQFAWDNSYAEQLPGFYVSCDPSPFPDPRLLQFNHSLADELGLNVAKLDASQLAAIFSGAKLPAGAQPLAQAYAGHQFGGFVPQLGDGRALLLGEVIDVRGQRRDIALKGSGPTPFSRGGDGKAAVGPVLREYLVAEAMHALGVPTTRALAAVGTGEMVRREGPLPGAVFTRVAASHIRVGTFEFFAARRQFDQLRTLADFVIERHDPGALQAGEPYMSLLKSVAARQAALLAQWMLVGFVHGVMNTDNMAVSGETIDYGPCAFMESYDPHTVFSSIDSGGRYAYGNQPMIARWNLARFAETLLPLIDESAPEKAVEEATEVIEGFLPQYESLWLTGLRTKFGLTNAAPDDDSDRTLAAAWFELLEQHGLDFTLAWRRLADAADGNPQFLEALFPSADVVRPWLDQWRGRLGDQSTTATAAAMRAVNPIYIPRNHLVEQALAAALQGDLSPFEQLKEAVTHPYNERPGLEAFAQPAPAEFTACYKTFCGT